jgi:uncharacterized protein (TIGR00255 family)
LIRSMTGFGTATVERAGLSVRVEIRSVNHRYLQVKARLPGEFQGLDPQIEAVVKKKLERGAVSATINVQRLARADRAQVSHEVARRYKELLGELAKDLKLDGDISLEALIQLPGVIGVEEDRVAQEREGKLVLSVCSEALAGLVEMRQAEGANLDADLRKNSQAVARIVARIETRMPKVVAEHHKNLKKRLADLLDGRRVATDADLAREMALIADRTDVAEEVSRLNSHLEQVEKLLDKGKAIGRQLDFLVQECMREANTIGSKCNDARVAHDVVELKTHIERLREQAQNVE